MHPSQEVVENIRTISKYREVDLPETTIQDLLDRELSHGYKIKQAEKNTRRKLHNIIAPYLGNPDYDSASADLLMASRSNSDSLKAVSYRILQSHASTRERLSIMEVFFQQLFNITGTPASILDLACGLNPLAFPWMGLPLNTRYHAYDIHKKRVELINLFFKLQRMEPLAEHIDILVNPPKVQADIAFFFKEAHRFEQRQKGCNRDFWQKLRVKWLLVSLPARSLSGSRNLVKSHRRLVETTMEGEPWTCEELVIENELVFVINKEP